MAKSRGGLGVQAYAEQGNFPGSNECQVSSSAIAAIGYDEDRSRLTVTFQSGRAYAYFNVSPRRYQALCDADSKGRYFNSAIRNKYSYAKLG